ncbi:hypothetical protein PHA51_10755 [Rodentibacter pneumotropicus]|uniref:hypothetical protein n=1 Tax=Rodentibacter pneumotropicus TaxID=758 RepID=UPI0023305397|nr:hypothetical protein [Rodentibacter pneumotropicus]MDC2826501.1 hypothetical protein [Rodentibacter pneumotropicus]
MFRFFIGILGILFLGLLISFGMGSLTIFVFAVFIPYFVIFVFAYYFLYFIIHFFYKKPFSSEFKFFLLIPTALSFWGYYELNSFYEEKTRVIELNKEKFFLRKALENLPSNIEISDGFIISTQDRFDNQGNPITFKWGELNLTSLDADGLYKIKVSSLNQPKELPKGMLCSSDIIFERKDESKQDVDDNTYRYENYRFDSCKIKNWILELNNQKIQIENFILHSNDKEYIGYKYNNIAGEIKKAANKLNLTHYWVAVLDGYARLDNEWIVDGIALLLNEEAQVISLLGTIQHSSGLNNIQIQGCLIRPSQFVALLSNPNNGRTAVDLEGVNTTCPSTIEPSFAYFNKPLNSETSFYNRVGDIQEQAKTLLSPFLFPDPDIRIAWKEELPRLYTIYSDNQIPFFWNNLKMKRLEFSNSSAYVELANDSLLKLETFYCAGIAYFKHNLYPIDNSLTKKNFTLMGCNINNGKMKLNNQDINLYSGKVSYFFPKNLSVENNEFFHHQEEDGKLVSDYIKIELEEELLIMKVEDSFYYLKRAILDNKGNVIALSGRLENENKEETFSLENGRYNDNGVGFKLFNFSKNEVDMTLSYYLSCKDFMTSQKNSYCDGAIQRHTYELIH